MSTNPQVPDLHSVDVGRLTGYSTQQIRDLERLGCLPPTTRGANGYRRFRQVHVVAARAYRALAAAVGPLAARKVMPTLLTGSLEEAAERIDDLHAGIAHARAQVREAREGMDAVRRDTTDQHAVFDGSDAMTIRELSQALDVRASALRYWEEEQLVRPERVTASRARLYRTDAIAEARIVAALRTGGYRIPAIRGIVDELRHHGDGGGAHRALDARLEELSRRSVGLLRAAGDLYALVTSREAGGGPV